MGDAGRGQGWGRGNTLSSEERETKTFFKRSCICCLFLHKVFHSQTYQLRAGIIPFAPEPAVWERLSPPHAALARVAQLELKGRALRWRRCCHLGAEPGLGLGGGWGLGPTQVSSQLLWLPHSMVAGLPVSRTWPWKSRTSTSATVTAYRALRGWERLLLPFLKNTASHSNSNDKHSRHDYTGTPRAQGPLTTTPRRRLHY